ncbi:hypothetical protein DM01DRAFT_1339284 [Hesseltinella vesiculosa]|uniref:Uncharacterized protein n=1 Tax=Hesseltinella vesiculosa TaxID=101127 RepID=A0A1X2G796_9FUNG|nr:hypothetical protein DM01DRAFT_1339284 [Hesseltinella vesiculosa]
MQLYQPFYFRMLDIMHGLGQEAQQPISMDANNFQVVPAFEEPTAVRHPAAADKRLSPYVRYKI